MKKRKTRRSRCASDTCRTQFRHADPSAETCSSACRQRVYRIRRKAKEEATQERERTEKYARFLAAVRQRDANEHVERQAAERERFAAARQAEEEERPSQPKPKRNPYPTVGIGGLGNPAPEPQVITISLKPKRAPMTPLYRGRR